MTIEDDEVSLGYLLDPCFELSNSEGKPLTGGYIELYIHGTRNKYYACSDWNGTLHPFQIPLDSLGSNIVLASPDNAYDVYVYNKYGSLIMSRYNVHCQGGGSGSGTYVGDKLFYGQYTAQNAAEIVSLSKTKGNIDIDSDGYLQLKQGLSYHITVRGAFHVNDITNTETTLNYIEYSTISPIKVDIDFTKADPQNFELSYDIYDLAEDMAYQVAFEQINGMVTDLVVEIHSLSNLATTATFDYEAGDYISIVDNTISVTGINPEDYSTHSETYESIVTAIELVTSIIPEAQVQSNWTETDNTDPSYIQNKPNEYTVIAGQNIGITIDNNDFIISASGTDLTGYVTDGQLQDTVELVTGLIPDVSDLTTHTEVYEATVTAIEAATAVIPDTEEVQFEEINLSDYALATAIPVVTGYATHSEVHESIVSAVEYVTGIIPDAQVQSDWTEADTEDPAYIQNKPIEYSLVAGQNIGITLDSVNSEIVIAASATDLSDYTTKEELQDAVELVTGLIPSNYATDEELQDAIELVTGLIPTDYTTKEELQDVVELVTGLIPSNYATPEDIQDAVELVTGLIPTDYATDEELQDAIELVTGKIPELPDEEEVEFEEINLLDYALVSAIPDVSNLVTKDELQDGLELVTGLIPDVSNLATKDELQDDIELVTGLIPDISNLATKDELQDGLELVTGLIPDVSNLATKDELQDDIELVTGLIPSDYTTHDEVYEATVSAIEVATGAIPDTEEVQFEELDITQFAQASAIPDISNLATKDELQDGLELVTGLIPDVSDFVTNNEVYESIVTAIDFVSGIIPDAQVQSDWDQVDNTKVDYIKNKPEEFGLVAGQNIGITSDSLNYNIVISATGIPTVQLNSNDQVTGINGHEIAGGGGGSTYTAGQYISIDANDVISVTGVAAATAIPESEEVTFEEIDLTDYALASAIPSYTAGNCISVANDTIDWITTAGITDIQMVSALPQDPVSSVLYIIPEA